MVGFLTGRYEVILQHLASLHNHNHAAVLLFPPIVTPDHPLRPHLMRATMGVCMPAYLQQQLLLGVVECWGLLWVLRVQRAPWVVVVGVQMLLAWGQLVLPLHQPGCSWRMLALGPVAR